MIVFSSVHFLTVSRYNAAIVARSSAQKTQHLEELANEDVTRRAKKTTTLFYGGQQSTPGDLLACISNLSF